MNLKSLARCWCPPILLKWARRVRSHNSISFDGNYASWAEAEKVSTGYNSAAVFQRVRDAALKVKRGEAVFERDSVCFYHEEFRWPTLACLLAIAAERGGQLRVLDFGGSLGSFYFQHRKFFSRLKEIRWAVVEQKHFVECGRDELQDEVLRFYESIDDCLAEGSVDVVFLSSVLQYLERPYDMLAEFCLTKAPYLLIDRTPFIARESDRLTVQHVPDSIYKASYPAWFFSQQLFETMVAEQGYSLIAEFSCDNDKEISEYKGILLERV